MKILDFTDKPAPSWFIEHNHKHWASPDCVKVQLNPSELARRKQLIEVWLEKLSSIIKTSVYAIPGNLEILLTVGCGTSNGHAFIREDGTPIVWLALESYETDQQIRIFVTHEIVHGLHYAANPELAFETREQKLNLGRQIVTEGIATWITQQLLGCGDAEALWADYISKNKACEWLSECQSRQSELFAYALDRWNESNPTEAFFYANNPNDILKYRAGYFVGLELAKYIANNGILRTEDLVSLKTDYFKMQLNNLKI